MLLRTAGPDVEGDDGQDPAPTAMKAMALATEDAARAVAGVTNSEGAGVSAGRSVVALATSHGFCRGYTTSGYGLSASVVAGSGSEMQRDYAHHGVRHHEDLDDPERLGRLAGERAVARLAPTKLASGSYPVVFDPRVGSSLLGHLLGAITGSAITRKTSFLLDREGEQIFRPGIVIRDEPLRPRGLRSKPFDGEGLATKTLDLVSDGRLIGWLLDSASARFGRKADRLAPGQRLRASARAAADGPRIARRERPAGRGRHQCRHAARHDFA
jgi:PmbA protein